MCTHAKNKGLARIQECQSCQRGVDSQGDHVHRWSGHQNLFWHRDCYQRMLEGDEEDSPQQVMTFPVSNDEE